MTRGQLIKNARKKKGWTQSRLGKEVNLAQSAISALENDDPDLKLDFRNLFKVSEALNNISILAQHCEECPIRIHLLKEYFDITDQERKNFSILGQYVRKELDEACKVLDELIPVSSSPFEGDPKERQKVKELYKKLFEIERRIWILRHQMVLDLFL